MDTGPITLTHLSMHTRLNMGTFQYKLNSTTHKHTSFLFNQTILLELLQVTLS